MIDGYVVCRLVRKKKGMKITKGVTIWCNEYGWCKARTDKGIDKWFRNLAEVQKFIDDRLLQKYEIEGEIKMPEKVISQYAMYTEEI